MPYNYELIYYMRQFQDIIQEKHKMWEEANQELMRAKKNFRDQVCDILKIPEDQLKFSNIACLADGIHDHVYLNKSCVFCDCNESEM